MRMVGIADRVFAMLYIDGPVIHHLDILSVENAVVLGSYHIVDEGLSGVEIIIQALHLV